MIYVTVLLGSPVCAMCHGIRHIFNHRFISLYLGAFLCKYYTIQFMMMLYEQQLKYACFCPFWPLLKIGCSTRFKGLILPKVIGLVQSIHVWPNLTQRSLIFLGASFQRLQMMDQVQNKPRQDEIT